jgi:hypothetical protein
MPSAPGLFFLSVFGWVSHHSNRCRMVCLLTPYPGIERRRSFPMDGKRATNLNPNPQSLTFRVDIRGNQRTWKSFLKVHNPNLLLSNESYKTMINSHIHYPRHLPLRFDT